MIALARPRLQRSTGLDIATGASVVSDSRTSEGAYLRADETPLVTALTDRAAGVLGIPRAHLEPPQVIRYGVGAKYAPHVDTFDPAYPGAAQVLAQGGQRTKTLLLYLNTPEQGGPTRFPDADHQVEAITGHAAEFESCALHGGDPVIAGEKWAVNFWARERPYGSAVSDGVFQDWIFNAEDCATLRAYYDANVGREEGGVDHVVRPKPGELQPFIDRVKERVDRFCPERKVVETVALARMTVAMSNHADNVRWDGSQFVPNHTPDRTHTAVVFLSEGGTVHYGDNPSGPAYSLDITPKEGHAHIHRCGPAFHHRVSASVAPRYTFIVWFKKPHGLHA